MAIGPTVRGTLLLEDDTVMARPCTTRTPASVTDTTAPEPPQPASADGPPSHADSGSGLFLVRAAASDFGARRREVRQDRVGDGSPGP
ncbi:hypothetical protein [Streptomyces sp. NPDC000133]|uniref:hypothetical protein n=1 Tax=Streptomyces sp. NPDC000133 TaxID=3364535 RepID=UPI00368E2DB5